MYRLAKYGFSEQASKLCFFLLFFNYIYHHYKTVQCRQRNHNKGARFIMCTARENGVNSKVHSPRESFNGCIMECP